MSLPHTVYGKHYNQKMEDLHPVNHRFRVFFAVSRKKSLQMWTTASELLTDFDTLRFFQIPNELQSNKFYLCLEHSNT